MSIVTALQVAVSLALIGLILIQERSSGASGLFGGTEGGFYQTRRGLERFAYTGTIVLIVIFAGLSLVNLLR
jgi:protein translocase SecG subunit